jgi:hypothetical protein
MRQRLGCGDGFREFDFDPVMFGRYPDCDVSSKDRRLNENCLARLNGHEVADFWRLRCSRS